MTGTLFPTTERGGGSPAPPAGLRYQPDLISPDEEEELLRATAEIPLGAVVMHGVAAKRTTAHFGWSYHFDSRGLAPTVDIPPPFLPLRERCAALAEVAAADFAELLVTRYPPGAGIGWHRDAPPFGVVAGVSLLSDCVLRFRRKAGERYERYNLLAARRSAYVLAGESRTAWQHGIDAVPEERWSLTFRTLRRKRERQP